MAAISIKGAFDTVSFILHHPLSRNRKQAALRRFLAWQIGSRLVPGPVAFPFANGSWLLARPGLMSATGNLYVGLQEFSDMAFLLHFLRGGDLFVDVGANIGAYTVLAAAGAGASVVAFEPVSAAFGWLERNVRFNAIGDRTELRRQAVGAQGGQVELTTGQDSCNHVVDGGCGEGPTEAVALTTLDAALGGRTPIMVKIDVEGFETAVLKGAAETLSQPTLRCVLLELNGSGRLYGYDDDAIRSQLVENGFQEYVYRPFERALSKRAPGDSESENSIFVRDYSFVSDRLRNAKPISINDWRI